LEENTESDESPYGLLINPIRFIDQYMCIRILCILCFHKHLLVTSIAPQQGQLNITNIACGFSMWICTGCARASSSNPSSLLRMQRIYQYLSPAAAPARAFCWKQTTEIPQAGAIPTQACLRETGYLPKKGTRTGVGGGGEVDLVAKQVSDVVDAIKNHCWPALTSSCEAFSILGFLGFMMETWDGTKL